MVEIWSGCLHALLGKLGRLGRLGSSLSRFIAAFGNADGSRKAPFPDLSANLGCERWRMDFIPPKRDKEARYLLLPSVFGAMGL